MGTPSFAVTALDALVAAGHGIAAVYTRAPRPGNRGRLQPSAVECRARELGLPVRTPARLADPAEVEALRALDADLAVVAAYGLLLPPAVLEVPRLGCINIHASLLPRWRGAAPVQRAILAGDAATGVSIMRMDQGLDTGPVYATRTVAIAGHTAGELTAVLAREGAAALLDVVDALPAIEPRPQPAEGVVYAAKIDKAEARIDWRRDAVALERLVRAMQPAPGAWFQSGGQRVKLIGAEPVADAVAAPGIALGPALVGCGAGALRLIEVQPAGRPRMAAADWWRGRRFQPGQPVADAV